MTYHSPIGGSNWAVTQHCPGAAHLYALHNANKDPEESNPWAERGARIHRLAEALKRNEPVPEDDDTSMARRYTAALHQLAPLHEWEFEVRVGHDIAGGTIDALHRSRRLVVDLKTGTVPVEPDSDQNRFYAALLGEEGVWTLGIYQEPDGMKLCTFDLRALKEEARLIRAAAAAFESDRRFTPGPHCAKCNCRVVRAKAIHAGKCGEWKEPTAVNAKVEVPF